MDKNYEKQSISQEYTLEGSGAGHSVRREYPLNCYYVFTVR